MGRISISTWIDASPVTCFDLSRSVEAHIESTPGTSERVVGGVTTGLLDNGDRVTWEAVHFGLGWRMTVGITEYNRPNYFVDEMIEGPFRYFRHFHGFHPDGAVVEPSSAQRSRQSSWKPSHRQHVILRSRRIQLVTCRKLVRNDVVLSSPPSAQDPDWRASKRNVSGFTNSWILRELRMT